MARPCETPPKKWLPALINSFDENWLAVGGGDDGVTSGDGAWGGIVPLVCAVTGVHTMAAITLAIAATRKLIITAGSPSASNSRTTLRSRSPLSSRNERMLKCPRYCAAAWDGLGGGTWAAFGASGAKAKIFCLMSCSAACSAAKACAIWSCLRAS